MLLMFALGGQVPGAEDAGTKEEAWKIQARNRAHTAGTAARERAKSRWRSAALELAGHPRDAQGATPHAGAQRFADLVGLVAASRKKEIMGLRGGRDTDASCFSCTSN